MEYDAISIDKYQRFGRPCCTYLQCHILDDFYLEYHSRYFLRNVGTAQCAPPRKPRDLNLQKYLCENFKFLIALFCFLSPLSLHYQSVQSFSPFDFFKFCAFYFSLHIFAFFIGISPLFSFRFYCYFFPKFFLFRYLILFLYRSFCISLFCHVKPSLHC